MLRLGCRLQGLSLRECGKVDFGDEFGNASTTAFGIKDEAEGDENKKKPRMAS